MRQSEVTFQTLAEEEANRRVTGKLQRAAKTRGRINRSVRTVHPAGQRERFLGLASKAAKNKCWLWIGCIDRCGYGKFNLGKESLAHRIAWVLFRGNIPARMYVLHSCDNPSCVNPQHLFLGTQTDNMRDCIKKNRFRTRTRGHWRGTRSGRLVWIPPFTRKNFWGLAPSAFRK